MLQFSIFLENFSNTQSLCRQTHGWVLTFDLQQQALCLEHCYSKG